jgi:hypothetical protein
MSAVAASCPAGGLCLWWGAALRCLCGSSGLLADCEDWRTPLCWDCWERLGSPHWEPLPPIRQILAIREPAGELRELGLSCGHQAHAMPAGRPGPVPKVGAAWPCVFCVDDGGKR